MNTDAYHFSFAPEDFQLERVHAYLSASYWTPGISAELVMRAFQHSLAVGAFTEDRQQIGCARLVTDYTSFGYLADVFVDEGHRGRVLARRMTRLLLDHPELRGLRRILLATRDAHGVYATCGFLPLEDATPFMQIHRPFKG